MTEQINSLAIEDRLGMVERKLQALGSLFFCCDDCVSMTLNCDQLNGLSVIMKDLAEEMATIGSDLSRIGIAGR